VLEADLLRKIFYVIIQYLNNVFQKIIIFESKILIEKRYIGFVF